MNKMEKALHELSEMDDLAAQDSPIHRLQGLPHPPAASGGQAPSDNCIHPPGGLL